MVFVVDERTAGAGAPRRVATHPDAAAAEHEALALVAEYGRGGWRVVEFVRDGRRQRWVLRRGQGWASVEVRDEEAPAPPE